MICYCIPHSEKLSINILWSHVGTLKNWWDRDLCCLRHPNVSQRSMVALFVAWGIGSYNRAIETSCFNRHLTLSLNNVKKSQSFDCAGSRSTTPGELASRWSWLSGNKERDRKKLVLGDSVKPLGRPNLRLSMLHFWL